MPSSGSPSTSRSLFGPSRISVLEKRLAEVEKQRNEQQAIINQQAEQIAHHNQALQASDTTHWILQGRIDRLEKHVSTMETQLESHNELLYDPMPEAP